MALKISATSAKRDLPFQDRERANAAQAPPVSFRRAVIRAGIKD